MTNKDVIQQFVSLTDKFVIDAGCGSMVFTRILSELGARVLAIDPDPIQAELNRTAEAVPNIEFVETGADQYPVEAHTVDGVFFSYSLHHISKDLYRQIFAEVARVLKPDGFLYVLEPMGGPLDDVMKLFHNEEQVRADAQAALEEIAIPAFNSAQVVTYHNEVQYESFEDFAQQYANRTFNAGYTEADVRQPKVQEAYEQKSMPGHRFQSFKQVMILRGLKQTSR